MHMQIKEEKVLHYFCPQTTSSVDHFLWFPGLASLDDREVHQEHHGQERGTR